MRIYITFFLLFFFSGTFGQTYALIADRMIDTKNDRVLENPIIIVKGKKIVDIRFDKTYPDTAIVIDLKGYSLMPGFMDVHTHILAGTEDYDKDLYENSPSYRALRAVAHLRTSLLNGFTTIRDVCTEGAGFADIDLSRAVDSGFIDGPRIFPSGKGIAATDRYVPSPKRQNWELRLPSGTQYATGVDECTKAVREQVSKGVKWIKLYSDWGSNPTFNYEELVAVVKEAKKYKVPVAAHATSKEGLRLAILAGVRSIEHGKAFDDSLIQLALKNNVYWSPTISVFEYFNDDITGLTQSLNKAYRAKLKIVYGTDIGSFPWTWSEAKEFEIYVKKAGFTSMDAIKTATTNTAELLGINDRLGSLEKGFIADIIAVKGNPMNDITLLQNISFVMKEGKIYKHIQ
jgi:imidazolonepropionase-like amidohydrolase